MNNLWALHPDYLNEVVNAPRLNALEKIGAEPLKKTATVYKLNGGSTAVIPITGVIAPSRTIESYYFGWTTLDVLAHDFKEALNNSRVKNIVFYAQTPGGDSTAVAEMADMIYNARGIKPIHVYTPALLASAGVWLGLAADKIWAHRTALVGSVGVLAATTKPDGEEIVVKSQHAQYKYSDDEEQIVKTLQSRVDALEGYFLEDLAKYRGLSVEHVQTKFGQGDVLPAAKAVEVGMIDWVVTGFDEVIKNLQGNAGNSMDTEEVYTKLSAQLQTTTEANQQLLTAVQQLATGFEAATAAISSMKEQQDAFEAKFTQQAAEKTAEQERLTDLDNVFAMFDQKPFTALHSKCISDGTTVGDAKTKLIQLMGQMSAGKPPPPIGDDLGEQGEAQTFEKMRAHYMTQDNLSQADATRKVAKEHKELHAEYLQRLALEKGGK
ncbi:MAG: S49 family peptidase [Thiotrichaceae bacterium]|nr:S49 family peptidase [Thiotrichaceae bacterium]